MDERIIRMRIIKIIVLLAIIVFIASTYLIADNTFNQEMKTIAASNDTMDAKGRRMSDAVSKQFSRIKEKLGINKN